MGGDKFLHAPKTGDVVKVASLKESYFSSNYAGGRRFDTSEPVAGAAAAAAPAAPAAAAAAPAIDPEGRRRGAGRGRARRRRGQPPGLRPLHGDQVPGGAPPPDRPVHAGDRSQGGQVRGRAPGSRRCCACRRRAGRCRTGGCARRGRSGRRRRHGLDRRRRPAGRAARRHLRRLPGQQRVEGRDREVARQAGRQARPPARAAGHGLAGRVRRQEPQLRRRRLGRLLPDARRDLEPGRLQGLPRAPRAAGQVVHRPGARRQEEGDRLGRRRLRQGPLEVGRVDRRHRAPRRAVPRPLPAAAQGSPRAAQRVNDRTARPKPGRSSQLGEG